MLILSTFNSDYLQSPLQSLLKLFKPQPVNIKYVNKNLIVELLNLKSNLEEKNSYVILFRINDFKEISDINLNKLEDHLDLIVKQITVLKQEKGFPILVFLCPILSEIYNNNPILEALEKKIIKSLNENKIHTLTLSNIKERYGDIEFENPVEGDTHIPYVPKFYAAIAALLARKLHAIIQKPYKVIAVDCDHTLWDGAAADLGAEAVLFKEHNIFLQNYLVEQQKKGIIICLCSKNEQQTVLDVFNQRQTEMPLKLHHINKYKINWKEKAENIKELALDLNVFPDSFLFIDDNPIEINNVSQIPGITCITMPQNLQECKDECLFDIDEHAVITETDKKRFELYKQAEIKAALATEFRDPIQFLRSTELGQSIVIRKIEDEENEAIERVSQLSGRTNQFNTFPEVEAKSIYEINEMVRCDKKEVFVGIIKDRDSEDNYEDISAISMCRIERNTIKINNFFVSCRSFNRGIEFEMLKHIAQTAQEKNIKNIKIKFKKSDKNKAASLFLNILSSF
jgi:FkbH-like protein